MAANARPSSCISNIGGPRKSIPTYFPIGTGLFNLVNLRFHWDQVPVPGSTGQKLSEGEFYTQTPGNNKYLVNYHVVPLGETTPPPGLKAADNRAFEANIRQNLQDNTFDTSERNDGHEKRFCHDANYNPNVIRPPTGRELWRRWQCPGALLDRACSEGDYLGSHGHMERQFHCHVRCSLSFAFPADIRRQGGSLRASSRSEGTGCATIKSRQVALT